MIPSLAAIAASALLHHVKYSQSSGAYAGRGLKASWKQQVFLNRLKQKRGLIVFILYEKMHVQIVVLLRLDGQA